MPIENKQKTLNDIVAYRKKRKAKRNLFRFSMFLLLVAGIVLIWINAETVFEPLRGIASKIETKTSDEVGFPVNLPGSATYSFRKFGNSFTLLTDTYLYNFNSDGGQNYASRHGYTNPIQRTSDRRVLVYDKSSYEFSLYNRTSKIYELTLEDRIVYGNLSNGDYSAIVTDSSIYSNVVYIYDGNGNWKYTRKFVDENVMQVAFSSNQKYIYVTTIGALHGDIISNVYKFNLEVAGEAEWKYTFTNNSIPCSLNVYDDVIIVIYDNACVSLNTETGDLNGVYSFSGTLLYPSSSQKLTALLINEISTNKVVMISLNENCEFLSSLAVAVNAVGVLAENDAIYELEGNMIYKYDEDLNQLSSLELDDEYSAFIKSGQNIYMLGYDTVQKERIQ